MKDREGPPPSLLVRVRMKQFTIPPVTDALVLGRQSPIGPEAMSRALSLLHVADFRHLDVEDDVIEVILVRENLLRKIPEDKLISLVRQRVKPFLCIDEVIHLHLEAEMAIEEQM